MTDAKGPGHVNLKPTVPADRSAIHVLAIGAGRYAYAPKGAAGRVAADAATLIQLSASPVSARAFADWAIT